MVGRSLCRNLAVLAVVFLAMAIGAKAQTAVWTGDTDDEFELGSNYQGGTAPNASTTVELPAAGGTITFNGADSVLGVVFLDPGENQWSLNSGTGTPSLTIGSGGIGPQDSETQLLAFFNVPIVLAADQTWNGSTSGFIYTSATVSGNFALTINGRVYLNSDDTFTGGLVVADQGTVYFGTNTAAGTGPISVQDGSTIQTFEAAITIPNPLTLADGAALGNDAAGDTLTFAGPVTFPDPSPTLTINSSSGVTFTGTVTGQPDGNLTIQGSGARLPADGGSQLVMTGVLSQFETLTVNNAQVILAPTGDPVAALGSLSSSSLEVNSQGYLGLGGTFAGEGALANFLTTYGPTLGPSISGSLGLESIGNSGTFSDPVDLTNFTSPGFLGLGTTTAVTLNGSITPAGSSNYVFGGGGGVLTITSSLLEFDDGTTLTMTPAPAPVTVILQGAISFSGGVTSNGGVLIFDTPTNQETGSMTLAGGYVGYTSAATDIGSPAAFLALLGGSPNGVIGFDTTNFEVPANITQDIDLSVLNEGSDVFLGTASAAILASTITITPSANDRYQFTGVKGGALTVAATLTGAEDSLVIGLPDPIEAGGSQSSVTLSGTNTFGGGTTLNSGILNLANGAALGTGSVTVTDNTNYLTLPPVISAPSGAVTVPNNLTFANLNGNPGLVLGAQGSSMLTLSGNLTDLNFNEDLNGYLAIAGPVTLAGNNTYHNGTIFNGTGNPSVTLKSSTALGSGTLTIETAGTLIAGNATVSLSNPIVLNDDLTIGVGGNTNTLTLDGALSGGNELTILSPVDIPNANPNLSGEVFIQNTMVTIGNELSLGTGQLSLSGATVTLGIDSPTIDNLSGDSASVVALESEATLTLYTPNSLEEFDGAITGDTSNSVVKTGAGAEYLTGTSTYGNGTDVSQGTLIAGSPGALGTGTVSVNPGATLAASSGVTLTNTLDLSPTSNLGGTGTFAPAGGVIVTNGITLSPGNPALGTGFGALSFTTGLTFGTSGAYAFNIANAGGSPGSAYSTLEVEGGLTITANPGSPFTIYVGSIDPESSQAGLAVFNPLVPYSWTLVSADSITGFSAANFSINTANFQNTFPGGSSTLTLVQAGNDLVLDFTPVPEPSTWALLLGGTGLAAIVTWRRRLA